MFLTECFLFIIFECSKHDSGAHIVTIDNQILTVCSHVISIVQYQQSVLVLFLFKVLVQIVIIISFTRHYRIINFGSGYSQPSCKIMIFFVKLCKFSHHHRAIWKRSYRFIISLLYRLRICRCHAVRSRRCFICIDTDILLRIDFCQQLFRLIICPQIHKKAPVNTYNRRNQHNYRHCDCNLPIDFQ